MDDKLPTNLKKGDVLKHGDVNTAFSHVNKFSGRRPGSFQNMMHTGSLSSESGAINGLISVVVVSSLIAAEGDTATSGLYKVMTRWFSPPRGEWLANGDKEWLLDERGTNTLPTLQVGSRLVAYWDEQRGCFVPIVWGAMVEFMLIENLEQFSGDVVKAAPKVWNPAGTGSYDWDCENYIYVADKNEVGHEADVGAFGMCKMMPTEDDPGVIGVIFDLCCRGDEMGSCGGL